MGNTLQKWIVKERALFIYYAFKGVLVIGFSFLVQYIFFCGKEKK